MIEVYDRDYYATRAETARRMEARAKNPDIAAIHRTMAERYDALAAVQPRMMMTR